MVKRRISWSISIGMFILGAAVTLFIHSLDILGPEWGAPMGPTRLLLSMPPALLIGGGMAVLIIGEQIRRPDWLVPPGKFVKGLKPRVWAPEIVIQIIIAGVMITFFKMIALGIPGVSLVCVGLLFVACYFGPLVVFFSVGLSALICAVTGLGGGAMFGILGFPIVWFFDGSIYALAGWFFRRFVWGHPGERRLLRYVPHFIVWNAWHLLLWTIIFIPIIMGPAWWGMLLMYVPTNYSANIISGAIGIGVVESVARVR